MFETVEKAVLEMIMSRRRLETMVRGRLEALESEDDPKRQVLKNILEEVEATQAKLGEGLLRLEGLKTQLSALGDQQTAVNLLIDGFTRKEK